MENEALSFEEALAHIKRGAQMTREGWNGKGMYVQLNENGIESNTHPYIEMFTSSGYFIPWVASQTDLLTEDWHFVVNAR